MSGEQVRLLIRGRVQGVYFRASAADAAHGLGLRGWVRNLADGRVEALAQGPREALDSFVDWCRRGPPAAKVDEVLEEWSEAKDDLEGFVVRR